MRRLFASIALAAVTLVPAVGSAQQYLTAAPAGVASQPATVDVAPAAPRVRADVAGIQTADHNAPLVVNAVAAQGGLHQGEGVALMAVGGAGLIAGLLIGDSAGTAVAIGGLAVGLVGLYEYVR